MKNEIIESVFEKMKAKDFGESMCNETKLRVLKWCEKQLHKHFVSNNEVSVCECEPHTFYEWEKDENKCCQCNKQIFKQTDC